MEAADSTAVDLSHRSHPTKSEEATRQQGGLFLGRIVPTEAKPSELSGEILSLAKTGVKA